MSISATAKATYDRKLREGKRIAGICVRCSGKSKKDLLHCLQCRKRFTDRQRLQHSKTTPEVYKDFHRVQQGRCAICGKKNGKKQLCADHDHKTNETRGLLCNACNIALGMFRDNPEILKAALKYLGW